MIKKTLLMALVLLVLTPIFLQAQEKSNLKILYVGPNPEKSDGYMFGGNPDTWNQVKQERAKVYHEFFQQYFNKVTLIYGEDYKESMSDAYDVTVFDALPPRLDGVVSEYLQLFPKGPDFLTEDYDDATVLIAGVGGAITWNFKGKIDWLCNCLDSHAYNIVEAHPIFNTPFKVSLAKEARKHNRGVYGYYSGLDLTKEEVPMWRVQEVDGLEGYPPGIVANPGFGDSPDAEFIANGPSIKSVNATALGRHGNFFQWGYRADPRHLTESGKLALINTIHYMSKFKGQKMRFKRVASHRLYALDKVFKVSDKGYDYELKLFGRLNDDRNDALARQLAGKPNPYDEYIVNGSSNYPDRTRYLEGVPKELIQEYVADWNAYLKYYEDNLGYIGILKEVPEGSKISYEIGLDQELQTIGVANNDIALLDKCIHMLEKGEQTDLATTLLKRYTTQNFFRAKDWRRWYKKNKSKLSFTETGGYKWVR